MSKGDWNRMYWQPLEFADLKLLQGKKINIDIFHRYA